MAANKGLPETMGNTFLGIESQPDRLFVNVKGRWIFDEVAALEHATATVMPEAGQLVTFQCAGLKEIDIAGAWVLYDRTQQLSVLGIKSEFTGFKAAHPLQISAAYSRCGSHP